MARHPVRRCYHVTPPQTIDLGEVQETLLIPLYLRARETRRADAIIRDPRALEIVQAIDYDFGRFDGAWNLQVDIAIRTEIFDEQVRAFIARHPEAIVVNLGAGLDGRFWRVDNGRIVWFDLDVPDAIELRRPFFPESSRNHCLAQSMFDSCWMDQVERGEGQPLLLLAEGLFCYFEEPLLRELFSRIADRWPGSEMLFQSISRRYVNRQSEVAAVKETRAVFKWGIDSGRELERWDPRYEFLQEWFFIDRHRHRWGRLRYLSWLPWVRRDLREVMKITRMRFRQA